MEKICVDCLNKSCAVSILSTDELLLLSGNSAAVSLRKGETLLKQGTLNSQVIYLKSGLVKEHLNGINKRDQIVQIIKSHSYLGLSSMFGNNTSLYSYTALEDIDVCYIDSNIFKSLVQLNGQFAYQILISVCQEQINNYHRCVNKSQKQMYGRFADAILYFSKNIYQKTEFYLPISQTDFAALIGTTRESVTRTFTKFKADGFIENRGRYVKILKMNALEDISKRG